jgi:hypothetical protein
MEKAGDSRRTALGAGKSEGAAELKQEYGRPEGTRV